MFFSIIIPIFNAQEYIERCLRSIMEQKFSDYEVILINDGSTDASDEICKDFCRKKENARLLHTNHIGASGARNAGIADAIGEYLVFVDADDTIENEMLEQIYISLGKEKIDVCYMNSHFVVDNDEKFIHIVFKVPPNRKRKYYSRKQFLELTTNGKNIYPGSMWLIVCNRRFVIDNEIWLNEDIEWSEDSDFSYNLFIHADRIAYCNYVGYNWYRGNTDSLSKRGDINKIVSRMDVYKKWYLYFETNSELPIKLRKRMMRQMLTNYCMYLSQLGLFKDSTINDQLLDKYNKEKSIWRRYNKRKIIFYKFFGLHLGMKRNIIFKRIKDWKKCE